MTTEDDSVALAAAWRERVTRGQCRDITVTVAPAGFRVRMHGARVAVFTAKYRAHAYAELLARREDGARHE